MTIVYSGVFGESDYSARIFGFKAGIENVPAVVFRSVSK